MGSRGIPRISSSGGGGGPPPGDSQDRFAPKYVVGNVLAGDTAADYSAGGFVYILDPGDGTGIEAALALAAVAPGDIAIRPGIYDFATGAAVMPLSVPAGVRIVGSGSGNCELRSKTAGDQGIFVLRGGAVGIEHIAFTVQSGGEVVYLGSRAVITNEGDGDGYVFRCTFTLSLAGTSVLRAGIIDAGPGSFSVRQCHGTGPSVGGSDPDLWICLIVAQKTGSGRLTAPGISAVGFDVVLLCDDVEGVDDVLVQDLSATGFSLYAAYQRGYGFLGLSDCYFNIEEVVAGVVVFGAPFVGAATYVGSHIVDSTISSSAGTQTAPAILIRSGSGGGYARVQNNLILWSRVGAAVTVGSASGSCSYNLIQNNQIFNSEADPASAGVEIFNNGVISNIVSANVIVASLPVVNNSSTTQIFGNTP